MYGARGVMPKADYDIYRRGVNVARELRCPHVSGGFVGQPNEGRNVFGRRFVCFKFVIHCWPPTQEHRGCLIVSMAVSRCKLAGKPGKQRKQRDEDDDVPTDETIMRPTDSLQ